MFINVKKNLELKETDSNLNIDKINKINRINKFYQTIK